MAAPERVTCCIAGCGPAGAMLGLLLARAGVRVLVLEKHADFLRDFRGDTIHPSTMQVMDELGLGEEFFALPLQRSRTLAVVTDEGEFALADFGRLPGRHRFIGFLPQWDFLDFLTDHARRMESFELRMRSEACDLLADDGRIAGVRYRDADGVIHEVCADLVVLADGRDSALRLAAGLEPVTFGAPMDVLWFRFSRRDTDREGSFGRVSLGRFMALIERGSYWQLAYVIPKDTIEQVRHAGLDAFRASVAELLPFLADRVDEISSWDDVRPLHVRVDRLRRWWRPGLLCIGDAAHAMSPIGGVGINLAVQDAVAAANILAAPLREGRVEDEHLARIQRRRVFPTVATQTLQRALQRGLIAPVLAARAGGGTPPAIRLLARVPALQVIPAFLVGRGFLPEHVRIA
jgi:2-polyprenyl-6-methoxyphenol hydroxylase-like FAD-dependent oxidoreductase